MTIDPSVNLISYRGDSDRQQFGPADEDKEMRYFFGGKSLHHVDETDEQDKPLFARAFKKLGRLKSDEMYGFKHRLALGGKEFQHEWAFGCGGINQLHQRLIFTLKFGRWSNDASGVTQQHRDAVQKTVLACMAYPFHDGLQVFFTVLQTYYERQAYEAVIGVTKAEVFPHLSLALGER